MPLEQSPLPGILPADLPPLVERCSTCEHSVDECDCEDANPVCPCCGDEFNAHEGIDLDGELHCSDCVHTCDECGYQTTNEDELRFARSSGSRRTDDVTLCSSCSRECADCNNRFSNDADGGSNASAEWVCERCVEHYSCCAECSTIVHEDNARYHEGRGETLCDDCYANELDAEDEDAPDEDAPDEDAPDEDAPDEDESPSARLIHDYSYKPRPVFMRADAEALKRSHSQLAYFGLEIEAENIGRTHSNEAALEFAGLPADASWYAKKDGSITHGVELVSHPGTWQYWKAHEFRIVSDLRKLRFRSYDTSSCGMHVHISRAAFTDLGVWKLMEFFRRNEPLIARLSRRACENLRQWAGVNNGPGGPTVKPSKKLLRPTTYYATDGGERIAYRKRDWDHSHRYAAINLENAATVEIRIFRGTLDVPAIKRNVALCAALVEFVRYTSIRELEGKHFVRWLKQYGKRTIGEPEASELIKWVTKQAESVETEA